MYTETPQPNQELMQRSVDIRPSQRQQQSISLSASRSGKERLAATNNVNQLSESKEPITEGHESGSEPQSSTLGPPYPTQD